MCLLATVQHERRMGGEEASPLRPLLQSLHGPLECVDRAHRGPHVSAVTRTIIRSEARTSTIALFPAATVTPVSPLVLVMIVSVFAAVRFRAVKRRPAIGRVVIVALAAAAAASSI